MQHRAQIGGLCWMLCTYNNVTDAPLMERITDGNVLLILLLKHQGVDRRAEINRLHSFHEYSLMIKVSVVSRLHGKLAVT